MTGRQLPALERDTAFFWTAGAQGRLRICRCEDCGRFQHPPLPRCLACGSPRMTPAPVSGRARVASFTINHERWLPDQQVPFAFAAVELVEQPELYLFTNIIGCPVEKVRIGLPVEVVFERSEDVFLPLFRPVGSPDS